MTALRMLFAGLQGYDKKNTKLMTFPPNPEDEEVHKVEEGLYIISSLTRYASTHFGL